MKVLATPHPIYDMTHGISTPVDIVARSRRRCLAALGNLDSFTLASLLDRGELLAWNLASGIVTSQKPDFREKFNLRLARR